MRKHIETTTATGLKKKWDSKQGYSGDYVLTYDGKSANLYDLSQIYAIKHGLWEPGVSMWVENNEGELWKYIFYYGRMIDPEELAKFGEDEGEEREEYIKETRGWYDGVDLVDKPREVLSDTDIIELLDSSDYKYYMESKESTKIEIVGASFNDAAMLYVGSRGLPLGVTDEVDEESSVEEARKFLYSSEWNKIYCEDETDPQLAPEFNK